MSALDDLTEEVLTTGRLSAAEFEVGVPVPVAFWVGEELGFVFSVSGARDGTFHAFTTGCRREPGGPWKGMGETIHASSVSEGLPERYPLESGWAGIDIFAAHGMGFHFAFPGIAAAGVEEVLVEGPSGTTVFPVFEPLGFFLAVVADPPPGTRLRLMARGSDEHAHIYEIPLFTEFDQPLTEGMGLRDKRVQRKPDEAAVWLAGQLAERLAGRLPRGWRVSTAADAVLLHLAGEWQGSMDLDWVFDQGDPTEEAIVLAAEHVLSHVQDSLADWSTDPWPAERSSLPVPYARIEGGSLICGYGPPDNPVMAIEPIPLEGRR